MNLNMSKNDLDIRLVLLLHDIGKPFSFKEGKARHYYNHAKVSRDISKRILKRLEYNE